MKIQPYVEKLNGSEAYKKFKQQFNDAFLVAGFFILDLETNQNIHQIDFYIPSQKKIAAFTLDAGIDLQVLDMMNASELPEKLDIQTNIDLDALEGILQDEMKNRKMTEDIKKIIAVVQNIKGKKIWNLNCVLSGMEVLKAHVEDDSKTVLRMEKIPFTDLIKKIPRTQLSEIPQENIKVKKVNAEDKIKQLEQLESEIEKEKARLKKNTIKKEKTNVVKIKK